MEDLEVIWRFLAPIPNGSGYGDGSGSGYGDGDGSGDGSGSGDGYGDGSGDGSGYGDGSGSGYGDGDGDGDGSGSGSGDGYGSGYGSGYGYGDGYGYGSGSGSGSGSGDGIKSYNGQRVWNIDDVPTLIESVHDNQYARGYIVNRDLTLEPTFVARVGNSFAHGKTLRDALHDAQQKDLEDAPIEERIERFVEAYPDPDALHPCRALYDWHHVLTGSCTQGRDSFVREHGLDMGADYSVRYFIEITAHAYGGDAIRQLAKAYGITLGKS